MIKKLSALLLALLMVATALVGCGKKDEDDKGAYVMMYLSDLVYDLDPVNAYTNESALRIVSLMFDNLFVLDENGKVKKSLAKDYKIIENEQSEEYKMEITLNETYWTDGMPVTANDVVFSWKRIMTVEDSYSAASLLFDVKNARAIKEGEGEFTIDDLGVCALDDKTVEVTFEEKIDYDQFLVNLTSYTLCPLREEITVKTTDWAKKPASIVSSGPFRLREASYKAGEEKLVFERNAYYYRNYQKDKIDKSVTPYRLVVDFTKSDEDLMKAYENGELFYVGDIPMSVRADYKDVAEVTDALSTHTYVLNQNAVIRKYSKSGFAALEGNGIVYNPSLVEGKEGDKIFADANIRKAMSLAIDRDAIAEAVVFAKAATALVPDGIFNAGPKKGWFGKPEQFRKAGGDLIATSANMDEAQALIKKSDYDPADYMFAISVAAQDEVHMAIAEMVKAAWEELGFHVAINAVAPIPNDDKWIHIDDTPKDIMDDIFNEAYRAGQFEVAAVDTVAYSADAFTALSVYAKAFAGQGMDMTSGDYTMTPHISGYDSEEYNELMEEIYDEKDIKARAELLHEAEELLMEDMPVIPIIFNQHATLTAKGLSKVKATYYTPAVFTKAKLKNYEQYIPAEEQE